MRIFRVLVSTIAVVSSLTIVGTAPAVAAAPSVVVQPSTGLEGGDRVAVRAAGLPPGADARLIQCDEFFDDIETDCAPVLTGTIPASGKFTVGVTVNDPIYRSQPFGDATPVYCRADACRIFVAWTTTNGDRGAVASQPLEFTGSPATIKVQPATNLDAEQDVWVGGTAYGAEGKSVTVVEEICFAMVQGSGCNGATVLKTRRVFDNGKWLMKVRVTRTLFGNDCNDPDLLGECQLTVRIGGTSGQPDDSFGVARIGDQGASLEFHS
ncbi:MAG: hypothetical protein QOG53_3185 [Frankiales bacterium]|jgi:hypothetical protein|nr:hypothetical protein [Frankiales bacterium]